MADRDSNRCYLRDATQCHHAQAESSWTRDGKFRSRRDYQGWLFAVGAAHQRLGQTAALVSGPSQAIATEQSRIAAIRQDCAAARLPDSFDPPCSTSWAYGVQYALNGSAIGAATLLKSRAIPSDWPTQYLQVMWAYVASGELGRFFAELDRTDLDRAEAASGAMAVFEAIARETSWA